jgi:hypothetical protein
MTGFESKRRMAQDKLDDDDDTQVYADTLLLDDNGDFSDRNWMAEKAYAFADAMLKARNQ